MICRPGICCRSSAVHSIPDRLGRWMSINTTPGGVRGIAFSASSALPQLHAQWNPAERFSIRSNVWRSPGSSSTTATVVVAVGDGAAAARASGVERGVIGEMRWCVSLLGDDGSVGQARGNLESAGNSGRLQATLGELAEIPGQRRHGVVSRVDRPDDLVEGRDQFPRPEEGAGHGVELQTPEMFGASMGDIEIDPAAGVAGGGAQLPPVGGLVRGPGVGLRIGEAFRQQWAVAERFQPLGWQGPQGRSHGHGGQVG